MIKELNFKDKNRINEVDNFLKECSFSEYNQSIEWNRIRNEERKFYLYSVDQNNNIVWVCSLLEKDHKDKYLLAPRGPVLNYYNEKLINLFFDEIKIWLQNRGYKKLVMNPCISFELLKRFPKNYNISILAKNDYEHLHDSCKLAIMDIEGDELMMLNKLPSKFRQNTRRSYRKGLTQKISKNIDFSNFYKLYLETSERHDFKPHTLDYFKKIFKEFKSNLIFLEVWYENIPLAMSIDIIYKDKLIYLYGVSSSSNRNLLGMYNLQWEAIKYCINKGIKKYDFGGVFCEEDDITNKDYGLYNFKKGYCYNGFIDIVPDIVVEME